MVPKSIIFFYNIYYFQKIDRHSLHHYHYRLGYLRPKSWDRVDLDRRKDRLHAVKPPKIPNSTFSNNNSNSNHYHQHGTTNTQNNNKTIIQLSSNGTLINNTLIPSNGGSSNNHENKTATVFLGNDEKVTIKENSHITNSSRNNIKVNCNQMDCSRNGSTTNNNDNHPKGTKIADICLVSRQSETKTVIVEVHRSPSDECNGDGGCTKSANIPPPPPPMVQFVATHNQQDRNSLSSSMSIPSSCDGISLSSAISEELKKRAEVREILYFFYLGDLKFSQIIFVEN